MRPNRSPKPISGYAYGTKSHWQESSDEDWDQEMYSPTGDERFVGVRTIDEARVNVWRSDDGYVAQMVHMTRNHKGLLRRNAGALPRPRRTVDPSLSRVARLEREHTRRERPFDPEARYPRETKRHHFAINPRKGDGIPEHLKEMRVEDAEYNGEDVGYSTYKFGKAATGEPQWYEVEYATGSDYNGGTVELSNYKVLEEMLAEHHPEDQKPVCWVRASGGHGTFSIAVLWEELDDEVKEALAGLEDYPLLDEEALSGLESELEDEAWENYYRKDFEDAVVKAVNAAFPDDDEFDEWPASDEDAYDLFRAAMDAANEQWIHESLGSGPYIKLEHIVAEAVKLITGEKDLSSGYMDTDYLTDIREGFDLEIK